MIRVIFAGVIAVAAITLLQSVVHMSLITNVIVAAGVGVLSALIVEEGRS